MDPPVSDPSAKAAIPAAIAAAEPPLEPPGTLSGYQGFLVVKRLGESRDRLFVPHVAECDRHVS